MKRFLCLIHDDLGWRTLARRLLEASHDREGVHLDVRLVKLPQWLNRYAWKPKSKWQATGSWPLFDTMTLFTLVTRQYADEIQSYDAVLTATQSMASGLQRNGVRKPIVVVVDATRKLLQSDFGAGNVSSHRIALERRVLNGVNHVISLSHWAANSIVEDYGLSPTKISVVPPFCPPPNSVTSPRSRSDRLKLVFIGGDFYRKGGGDLVRWHRERLSDQVDLTIVTNRQYHVEGIPSIRWITDADNATVLECVLPEMDLLCHPTNEDMSAFVVVEAASRGVPAIVTDVGGVGELVQQGVTGFVVRPSDREAIPEKILALAADDARLESMSQAALARAHTLFDAKTSVERIVDIVRMCSD